MSRLIQRIKNRLDTVFPRATKGRRKTSRRRPHYDRRLSFEMVEDRVLLSIAPAGNDLAASSVVADSGLVAAPRQITRGDFLNPLNRLQELGLTETNLELGIVRTGSAADDSLLLLSRASDPAQFGDIFMFDGQGRVAITVTASDVPQVEAALKEIGFEIAGSAPAYHFVEGYLPVTAIAELDALRCQGLLGVMHVAPPISCAGSVLNQADYMLESSRARLIPGGYDGSGVTVGVLSDSYNYLRGADAGMASGDLPSEVTVLTEGSGNDEGRAMMELIHDIAPGARLVFDTAYGNEQVFAQHIRDLANPTIGDCDIIVDDIIYFAEPFFQDGYVAQAVNEVVNNGVVYFSAAGNQANRGYDTTTISFVNQTITGIGTGYFFDFDPSAGVDTKQSITLLPGQAFRPVLQWDDPFYTSSIDTDLAIYVMDGDTQIASCNFDNADVERAVEFLGSAVQNTSGTTKTYDFVVKRVSGSDPGRLKYVDFGGSDLSIQYATNSPTINPHAGAANAIAVGAAYYGIQDDPEWFTSHGPTTILFNTDGSRKTSPEVRQKPDVTAIDGTDTTFFGASDTDLSGHNDFFGTSAAVAQAAGVAALMLDFNPRTPAQIATAMKDTARDLGTAGFDTVTGAGLLDAFVAMTGGPAGIASLPCSDPINYPYMQSIWETDSTGSGVIQCISGLSPQSGNWHVALCTYDRGDGNGISYGRNELTLHVNTVGWDDVTLSFWEKETSDDDNAMPATFQNHGNYDGAAFSVDGVNWYRILSFTGGNSTNSYQQWTYNLSDLAAAAGVTLGGDVRIRFQQWGLNPCSNDGILLDSLSVTATDIPPTVANVSATTANGSYRAAQSIDVTVQFSEVVSVTGSPQLQLETGSTDQYATYLSGSGTNTLTFRYTIQAGDTSADLDYVSTAALTLNGGTILDAAGNAAIRTLPTPGATGSLAYNKALVVDTVRPTVTGVSAANADGSYRAGKIIQVLVQFSERVAVTGTPRLQLETGATDRYATYAGALSDGRVLFYYTVQAGDTSADLDYVSTAALSLNGGTIKDIAGNSANATTLALPAPGAVGSLGYNKNIVIDTAAPTVTNVTSTTPNGTYSAGQLIDIVVYFSEAVSVTGQPQLQLETGATDRYATYLSGSGTNTLTFRYTVVAGDTSADLDYLSTAALTLNGGTINDLAGNAAILTLASPGATYSLGYNKNIVIA